MATKNIFNNDRRAVAWAVGLDLPRIHALLDETIFQNFARLSSPIERISNPGVIVGWRLYAHAPSEYAPSLPVVVEMTIPDNPLETSGELTQHSQWRAKGSEHVGWAVTEAKIDGVWQTFTTQEAALAAHGFQALTEPDPSDPGFIEWAEAIDAASVAQSGTYTLSEAELVQIDVLIDMFYSAAGVSLPDLLEAHRLGDARARHMQRLAATEQAT